MVPGRPPLSSCSSCSSSGISQEEIQSPPPPEQGMMATRESLSDEQKLFADDWIERKRRLECPKQGAKR
ncbi:hypothetical protein NPIL_593541 [Nephila pilipes]|uniref:Uncharacterized protein n=1 Tax=Nephila pilipes TaxID=299642 RepID=A0A8X6PN72_NEPPI|nr:hypothetical protein NPIL_593541 [Nephila pilipes]